MTVNALNIQALEPPLCVICIWYGEMIDLFALSGSTLFSVTNNMTVARKQDIQDCL